MKHLCYFLALVFTGCTVSITTVHTQGTASDVVDEQQSTDPEVQAEVPFNLADYSVGGRDVGCFQA